MENFKNGVHDPTIIKYKGIYYMFSTDTHQPQTCGIPIRTSKDLINWKFEGVALNGVPEIAKKWSNANGLWAPDVIQVENEFRIYYSASRFGSTTSFIGLAVAQHPLGPWEDKGEVIKTSFEISKNNAIDANICEDRSGNQWLVYGSFFEGIFIIEINKKSGKLLKSGFGRKIACRPNTVENAVEGPFILYNEKTDYFYLFVSYDSLNDFYNIRVARSKDIDGPYEDFNGNNMGEMGDHPDKVGTKLLGGYQFKNKSALYAPGHNSILVDGKNTYLVHHVRKKPYSEQFFFQIRPLLWLKNGWPTVLPYEYSSEYEIMEFTEEFMQKEWELIVFENSSIAKSINISCITTFLEKISACYILCKMDNRILISGMSREGYMFFGKMKNN